MCIVAFAWQLLDQQPLCLISNRDEFYQRPTSMLNAWPNSPIIAGQDLQSGGTWMGVTAQGRWAIVTNFRDGQDRRDYPTSRGALIQKYLASTQTPIRFAQELEQHQCDYAGFNLFVGDLKQAVYMSNRGEAPQVLSQGVYVVSNGLLSEGWAKTQHLRKRFTQEFLPLAQQGRSDAELDAVVWDILEDQRQVIMTDLPNTGIAVEFEQLLSSTYIESPSYGTRCSNFLRIQDEKIHWTEKTQQGEHAGHLETQNICLLDSHDI